jgi:hypothetical protein
MKLFQLPSILPDNLPLEKRIEIVQEIGRKAKEEFEKKYPSIKKWFLEYDALYILSYCVFYFLSYPEGTDPEAYEGRLDFYHHYLEIMQAFALTEERTMSATPLGENAEKLKLEMGELGDLMGRRQFDVSDHRSEEELREHMLTSMMRDQTTAVRNWAYPAQIFALTKGLVGTVKDEFEGLHRVEPTRLVNLIERLVEETEKRLNDHWHSLRKFMRKRDYRSIVKAYNKTYPDIKPIDEQSAAELYRRAGSSARHIKQLLLMHSDLRLADIYTFHLDEIVRLYGDDERRDDLKRIFDGWAFEFGDLRAYPIEHFVLDNPVLRRPFIKIEEDTYFSPTLGILPHLTLVLMESLISADEALRKRYNKARAKYLEDQVEELAKRNFPHAEVFRGSKWKDPKAGRCFENDLVVILDSFAIVIECKSGTVSAPAKRGAPLRLRRTLEELVMEAAEQANRFVEYLKSHRGVNCFSTDTERINKIDNSGVKYYLPLNVTLDDLGFVSGNMKNAIHAGLIKENVRALIPSMSLCVLECVFELLETEVEKIHYLARRKELEQHVDYMGDELDLLGFYLKNGFNIGELEYEGLAVSLSGTSKELDPYFIGKACGKKVKKPVLRMAKWWRDIIDRLSEKRPDG